jgi:2-iminoacetate synthase
MLHLFKKILNSDDGQLEQYLEESRKITRERFGNNIWLFAPMYLSNECQNICTYCGFSHTNKIKRKTLTDSEIIEEAKALKNMGFDSVLLVTGEDYRVDTNYIAHAVDLLKPYFTQISIEVQPLTLEEYIRLKEAGVFGVLVYQETYNRATYKNVHLKGKKTNFDNRLQTPDNIGKAGFYKIGLGVLYGLNADWKQEAMELAKHLQQLEKKYWQSKFSVSFPSLRPFEGEFEPEYQLTEKDLLRLMAAFRITFPDVEIVLTTRERAAFRDLAVHYGVTTMSAGSKTAPGEYHQNNHALKQFDTHDDRTPQQIETMIKNAGLEAVWKDWW